MQHRPVRPLLLRTVGTQAAGSVLQLWCLRCVGA